MAHRNIERNERMRVLHANGWAIADLARTFGLTWASVDQIVNPDHHREYMREYMRAYRGRQREAPSPAATPTGV